MEMQVLDQAEAWTDKNGVAHPIEGMDGRYALNVYNYLKAKAQVIGFHYGMYLATIRLPDPDVAAYDHVMDAIDSEHHRIGENPIAWLQDKPLMRALIARVAYDRVSRQVSGYVPSSEPLKFPPYAAPNFTAKPRRDDLDEDLFGQQPGDASRVFVVQASDYESTAILGVFVGNRLAAHKYLNEWERYNDGAEVVVFDDTSNAETPDTYAQVRSYREPWTEVMFRSSINLETAEVFQDWTTTTGVRIDADPGFNVTHEASGGRGRFNSIVSTTGPDTDIDQLRHLHAASVNKIRANVLDDLTKDLP